MTEVIVVGSGPAGVAASKGLLERGCKVTLLDVGKTLGPEKLKLLNEIKEDSRLLSKNAYKLHHSINSKTWLKLPYGSNFVYEGVKDYFSWNTQDCSLNPSLAQGGLSNVWGGAMDQYTSRELHDWPLSCRDLSVYYHQIIAWFGKYYTGDTSSVLSQQAGNLKNIWDMHQTELEDSGLSFHAAALAVNFKDCRFCGLCQSACPYGLIYHSVIHLDLLRQNPNFSYVKEVIIDHFTEIESKVELITNVATHRFVAERVFFACGAGISSMLYLRSLKKPNATLTLKDSQHFMLPCLMSKPVKGIMDNFLHTLCQLKISLDQKEISQYPIYLQLYTYMNTYQQEAKNKLKWAYPLLEPLLRPWLERLVVLQGYLNSKESNELVIQYQPSGKFLIKPNKVNPVGFTIHRTLLYLKKQSHYLAFKPLSFLLSQSLAGQSNHVGGSLPMSEQPSGDQVNIWGVPCHLRRVHFVDGSILPSIPAGPITLTIMANAYRIGKECPL